MFISTYLCIVHAGSFGQKLAFFVIVRVLLLLCVPGSGDCRDTEHTTSQTNYLHCSKFSSTRSKRSIGSNRFTGATRYPPTRFTISAIRYYEMSEKRLPKRKLWSNEVHKVRYGPEGPEGLQSPLGPQDPKLSIGSILQLFKARMCFLTSIFKPNHSYHKKHVD